MRAWLAAMALVAGCGGPRAELRTGALPSSWQRVSVKGATVALHHAGGGTVLARYSCDAVDEDAPLDVLINHLLLQLEKPLEHGREPLVLDGRGALRARLTVRLDGVPVELELVVFKKDGCVIDAQLVTGAVVEARRAEFAGFVAGLSLARRPR